MNTFRTIVNVPDFPFKINYHSSIQLIGSCFTENIGRKLEEHKFKTDINPFGIIYNPASVYHSLEFLINNKKISSKNLVFHDGLWHSFMHHGDFSDLSKETCIEKANQRIRQSHEFLKNAEVLFISWGTAWIYEYNKSGQVVSNCHKIPASEFTRKRMTVEDILSLYNPLLEQIHQFNNKLKVIFTVSPVRHLKDGAIENQVSKSTLLLAVHELVRHFDFVRYFPSYEIVLDDLRDYRFFAEDMAHPNDTAVAYIWEKFSQSLFDKNTQSVSAKVKKLNQLINHRTRNEGTAQHLDFIESVVKKLKAFISQYPHIDYSAELNKFNDLVKE